MRSKCSSQLAAQPLSDSAEDKLKSGTPELAGGDAFGPGVAYARGLGT